RADPQEVELGLQALRGAPRAAHDALGLRRRLDEREQALADGLRRGALEQPVVAVARRARRDAQPLGLHVLGDLAQRDLAQRGEVLDPEEVVQRRLDALAGVDLARA